jgi:hypothetical protein
MTESDYVEVKVRLSKDDVDDLERLAREANVSRNELIVRIVKHYLGKRGYDDKVVEAILKRQDLIAEVKSLKEYKDRLMRETEEVRDWKRFNEFVQKVRESVNLLDRFIKYGQSWGRDMSEWLYVKDLLVENLNQLEELRSALVLKKAKVAKVATRG